MSTTLLQRAAVLYLAVELVHVSDHLRQGINPTTAVAITGTLNLVGAAVLAVLALRADARVPMAAAAFGSFAAIGVTLTHGLPEWGAFSFSYSGYGVDALSWAIAGALVLAGVLLAAAGFRGLQSPASRPGRGGALDRHRDVSCTSPRPARERGTGRDVTVASLPPSATAASASLRPAPGGPRTQSGAAGGRPSGMPTPSSSGAVAAGGCSCATGSGARCAALARGRRGRVVAQEARLGEDLHVGLLDEVLGFQRRARLDHRNAEERVEVIGGRGRIEPGVHRSSTTGGG